MKRAIIVGFTADGEPSLVGGIQPFSEAITEFKSAVSSGFPPAPGVLRMELWESNPTKTWKFKPDAVAASLAQADGNESEAPKRRGRPKAE